MNTTIDTTLAGDYGYRDRHDSCVVVLAYDPDRTPPWALDAHTDTRSGMPPEVFHNRVVHIELARCSPILTLGEGDGEQIVAGLGDELPELLARIERGHSVEWDGRNYAGRFTDDASAAISEIETLAEDARILERLPQTWDAEEWFIDVIDDYAATDSAEILLANARHDGVRIWGGVDEIRRVRREKDACAAQ